MFFAKRELRFNHLNGQTIVSGATVNLLIGKNTVGRKTGKQPPQLGESSWELQGSSACGLNICTGEFVIQVDGNIRDVLVIKPGYSMLARNF